VKRAPAETWGLLIFTGRDSGPEGKWEYLLVPSFSGLSLKMATLA